LQTESRAPRAAARSPTTPDAQYEAEGSTYTEDEDEIFSDVDSWKKNHSPSAQRAWRLKLAQQNVSKVDDLAAELQALTLDPTTTRTSTIHVTARDASRDGLSGNLSPVKEPSSLRVHGTLDSKNSKVSSTYPNKKPKAKSAATKTHKAATEPLFSSDARGALVCEGIEKLSSRSYTTSLPSDTSHQLSATSQTEFSSKSQKRRQSRDRCYDGDGSLGVPSSRSTPRKKPAKKQSNLPVSSDLLYRSASPSTDSVAAPQTPPAQISEDAGEGWGVDDTASKSAEQPMDEDEEAPSAEFEPVSAVTPTITQQSTVCPPIFDKYHKGKREGRQLDLEILEIIGRDRWERKLKRSWSPLIGLSHWLLPSFLQQYITKKGKHPLSTFNRDHGFIYIFKSPIYPGYVKIGKTKRTSEERIQQWRWRCKFTCNHVKDDNDTRFQHYGIVELLVQAELWNKRRKFKCTRCKKEHRQEIGTRGVTKATEHGEWYEITEDHAKQVVERWRHWVTMARPYRSHDGILYDIWKWKHNQAMQAGRRDSVDWTKWTCLSSYDILRYHARRVVEFLGERVLAVIAQLGPSTCIFLILFAIYHFGIRVVFGFVLLCGGLLLGKIPRTYSGRKS
jgi:hypothetical protein